MCTFPTIPCRATIARQEMLHSCSTRDYTVCRVPTIPCRAAVALQEMLHNVYVSYISYSATIAPQGCYTLCMSYFSLYTYSSATGVLHSVTFPTVSCRATAALQEMLHGVYVSDYSLSHKSSTEDATQCVRFQLFLLELLWLQRRCYTVYVSYYSP